MVMPLAGREGQEDPYARPGLRPDGAVSQRQRDGVWILALAEQSKYRAIRRANTLRSPQHLKQQQAADQPATSSKDG